MALEQLLLAWLVASFPPPPLLLLLLVLVREHQRPRWYCLAGTPQQSQILASEVSPIQARSEELNSPHYSQTLQFCDAIPTFGTAVYTNTEANLAHISDNSE
ncbi:uncharacterized protein IUM83_12584 [Phytophthora cinnamomi]|uniref:uncharacterized protein n=1 Tax=Phytophthora cinnamomi TaxID=4785 RepID=UPI00355AB7CC|nr:hypothetical protein IUM83_12584 [Phytophthora cinnamomi]